MEETIALDGSVLQDGPSAREDVPWWESLRPLPWKLDTEGRVPPQRRRRLTSKRRGSDRLLALARFLRSLCYTENPVSSSS